MASGLYFMFEFFQLSMFNELNAILRKTYMLNSVQITRMSNIFLFVNILFLVPAGIILDSYSTRRVILITFFICVLSTFGLALFPGHKLIILFHGIAGMGNAFCLASGVILISRWFPKNQQARYVGLLITMCYMGGAFSQIPFNYLINYYEWHNALLIVAFVGLFFWLIIFFVVKDSPDPNFKMKLANEKLSLSTFKPALKNKQNWFAGACIAFMDAPVMVFGSLWGLNYLHVGQNLSFEFAHAVVSVFFLGTIIGCPLMGFISDRIGKRKPVMYFGAIGLALCYFPLLLKTTLPPFLLLIIFFLVGFFCSAQIIGYQFISEKNPKEAIGKSASLATFLVIIIGLFGAGLFGLFLFLSAGRTLNYISSDYNNAVYLFLFTECMTFLMLFFMKETYNKPLNEIKT